MTIEQGAFTELLLGASYCPNCLNTATNCPFGSLVSVLPPSPVISQRQGNCWGLVDTFLLKGARLFSAALGGSYHTVFDAVFQNCL